MADDNNQKIIIALKRFFSRGKASGAEELNMVVSRRERIYVFLIAYIFALSLWFIVRLNGEYSISLDVPIEVGIIPDDMALPEELPKSVQTNITGQGWQLISLYNKTPSVVVDIENGEINLFDQVRRRFNLIQDVEVVKVYPLMLNINLEKKISKKIPIELHSKISFQQHYGMIGTPVLYPDSLIVTGAASKIRAIKKWEVQDTLTLKDLREDVAVTINLKQKNQVVETSITETLFSVNVSEFTEGETNVYIKTKGLPRGQSINYNPSSITIKYDVPIEQFTEVQNLRPYEAYVTYDKIVNDSTGFVTPDIELTATQFQIKLRSFQPKAVAYFSVVSQ